jgi:DNA end-binding protein Ku
MPKAIWSGSISFGMVTIPVKLYGATESKDIAFHLLHAKDGTRLQQKRWCPTDDVEVPWSETVRGYEYAKGQYVILSEQDFERLPLPSKHIIDLSAVATITIRKKEQLCVLRPHEGTIMLETLYYPDEIRMERGAHLDNVKVSDRELGMAFTLIDILRRPFDPSEYHDHYREALAELIEAKLEGKQVVKAPAARETKVFDLADALKRSVEAAKKAKPKPPARARARTGRPARRTRKVG